MKKKILAICDPEEGYAQRLAEYLENRQGFPFAVRRFFCAEDLLDYAKQTEELELILLSESAYREELSELNGVHVMILNESGAKTCPELCNVDKYQSAGGIVREVMCYCADHMADAAPEPLSAAQMRFIGLYSPVHRCRQTSLALTMGQILARKHRVLYINLEGYSGFSRLFSVSGEAELTELVYYARHLENRLLYRIESMVRRIGELEYVPPVLSCCDLCEVSGEEWKELLRRVGEKCQYDYVILDLSDQVRGLFEILRMCGIIYTIVEDDAKAQAKQAEYEQDLRRCGYPDVEEKTRKCVLPRMEKLPEETELLPYTRLGDYAQTQLEELTHE